MKLASMMLACAFAVAACGGKKGGESTMTNTTTPPDTTTMPDAGGGATGGDGTPCAQEVALECPEGQIDACLKTPPEGDVHTCVAQ